MKVRVRLPRKTITKVDWSRLRSELHVVEEFTDNALREAQAASLQPLPPYSDFTDLSFFTIDPPGSLDLDQAMFLESLPNGHRVYYAIADVGTFVTPAGPLDSELHTRGETFYMPDKAVPLHPYVLCENAASLLPKRRRSAVVWIMDLDESGELISTKVERAIVRSTRRYSYGDVHAGLSIKNPHKQLVMLKTIGERRAVLAQKRGAVDLPTPEQLVSQGKNGDTELSYRAELPSEKWNEQISILTGIAAAQLMIDAGVGLLRTLPTPDDKSVESIRRSAMALGIDWPETAGYAEMVSSLDPEIPAHAAVLTLATKLLRGAAYTYFTGSDVAGLSHSGIGTTYAHCTAPLRRLADRYVNELCLALSSNSAIPEWVTEKLPSLPAEMATADRKAHALDRAAIDIAEAVALESRVGEEFDAVVVEVTKTYGVVQLTSPAVRAKCLGVDENNLGQRLRVRLESADVNERSVVFAAL